MGFQFSFEVLYLFLIYGHPRMSHLKNASNMYLLLFSHSVMSDSLSSRGLQTPGFPVLHHLLELAQTQVHWICDAIQPFHPLSSPSPAFNLSRYQGLFKWLMVIDIMNLWNSVCQCHLTAKILPKYYLGLSWAEEKEPSGCKQQLEDWVHGSFSCLGN